MMQVGSTKQEHPQSIRCWKFYNKEYDCYKNPNKATYAQLRKRAQLIRNSDVGNPNKECPICLKLMGGIYVKQIPCGHTFHVKCLKAWERKKFSCPMCRYTYGEIQLTENFKSHLQEFKKLYWDIFALLLEEERCTTELKLTNEMYDMYDDFVDEYDDIAEIVFSIYHQNGTVPLSYHHVIKSFHEISEIFENEDSHHQLLSLEQLDERTGIDEEEGLVWYNSENLTDEQSITLQHHVSAFFLL
jgi:hypothetical protein